jgi:hypothetical protein
MAKVATYNPATDETTFEDLVGVPAKADTSSFKGITRAKAKLLIKAGKHAEALTLLKTIGE